MGNVPRTNNVVEEWHRGFSPLASASHLNIKKFLEILKKEQSLTDVKIDNTSMRPQNESNKQTSFLNQRIRTLAARFHEMTPITFLKNMANIISKSHSMYKIYVLAELVFFAEFSPNHFFLLSPPHTCTMGPIIILHV
ncbi:hypothetical protein HZS_5445 [Henneguya salminicola]|nr:hypothetical protein HZS_5445 [Henneguya salminicola]